MFSWYVVYIPAQTASTVNPRVSATIQAAEATVTANGDLVFSIVNRYNYNVMTVLSIFPAGTWFACELQN